MKYSEFKAEVEKMGYEVLILKNYIYVQKNNNTHAKVSRTSLYVIDTHYGWFLPLYESEAFEIYEICRRLTETPLADREEEKRYWLKLKTTLPVSEKFRYLVLYKPEGEYIILNKGEGESHKSIFTESEISQMDITGFEKVEVQE